MGIRLQRVVDVVTKIVPPDETLGRPALYARRRVPHPRAGVTIYISRTVPPAGRAEVIREVLAAIARATVANDTTTVPTFGALDGNVNVYAARK